MSKPRVTPQAVPIQAAAAKTAPATIPLSDIAITWEQLTSPVEAMPSKFTITGSELAPVLSWLARQNPAGNWACFTSSEDAAIELYELSEICHGLEDPAAEADREVVLAGLARHLKHLSARLGGDLWRIDARVEVVMVAGQRRSSRCEMTGREDKSRD